MYRLLHKSMKKLLLFCVSLLFATTLFSQGVYEDVVYLKNGSIIHGLIIEQIPNVSIKIQTSDRNVFVFKIEEIAKITKELVEKVNENEINNQIEKFDCKKMKSRGYFNSLELGSVYGVGNYYKDTETTLSGFTNNPLMTKSKANNSLNFFILHDINSFKLNKKIALGFGYGIEIGKWYRGTSASLNIPFFLDFRIRPIARKFSPYFIEQAGLSMLPLYTNAIGEPIKVGALLNTKLGLSGFVNSKTSISFGLGYRFQHYYYTSDLSNTYSYYTTNGKVKVNEYYHFISFFFSIQL